MDQQHLQALLTTAGAKEGKDGFAELPDGKTITFYAAFSGVPLTVSRVTGVRVDGGLLHARSAKGETFIVKAADVFAGSIEGVAGAARKAGFL